MPRSLSPLPIGRPSDGPRIDELSADLDLPIADGPGWQSATGRRLTVPVDGLERNVVRLHLPGVWADVPEGSEPSGDPGASLSAGSRRVALAHGMHYDSADRFGLAERRNGDGTTLREIGVAVVGGRPSRLDVLSVDVEPGADLDQIDFHAADARVNFVIFDVIAEQELLPVCPFHSREAEVPLAEVATVVRVGDRRRFAQAVSQLATGLSAPGVDLDEARGLGLTFIAIVTAALLERGAPRGLHRVQLEAARELESLATHGAVAEAVRETLERITVGYLSEDPGANRALIDRALALVDRNFAKDLTDAAVSARLGLSPSHFRHLFRQATGKPFHRYVVELRLERARQLLAGTNMPIQEVAHAVGFASPAHFSRIFTRHFGAPPSSLRAAGR